MRAILRSDKMKILIFKICVMNLKFLIKIGGQTENCGWSALKCADQLIPILLLKCLSNLSALEKRKSVVLKLTT